MTSMLNNFLTDERRRWAVLVVVCFGQFMIVLDTTIVNVALPALQSDLGFSASDPASRAWFEKTQTPLLAWSSQARGFFLPGRAGPEKRDDAELVRCWYSEDNFERLARVNELARKRNVLPINIALAYVLNQPFPTFALIGPRQLSETRTSLPALDVELSPDELRWLNLE